MIGVYCMAMHAACSGTEGSSRQNQAYGELARYLYSLTFTRFADLSPHVREDVTQSALERIFKSFERCREPVAFLAFAGLHLLDAVRPARRHALRPLESLEQAIGVTEDTLVDDLDDPAVSRRLGVSLSSVYAARSRLIKTIQSEPKWQARARELGLLSDEV